MDKKFKIFISAVCTLTCAAMIAIQASAASFLTGDLNGDGQITAEDALLILQNVTGVIDTFPVDGMEQPTGDIVAVVSTEEQKQEDFDEQGRKTAELDMEYPVVKLSGNKSAERAINRTIQRVKADDSILSELSEMTLQSWEMNEPDEYFSSCAISYAVCRNSNILSLEFLYSFYYAGAAHDSYYVLTLNFDMTTGSLIEMEDITGIYDYSKFVYEYASKKVYEDISEYTLLSDSYELTNLLKNNWYINADGEIVYVFSPYEVASFAFGVVEANVGKCEDYMRDYYKNLLK